MSSRIEFQQEPLRATILEIQKMSTEDGPGIRTTVFFKGCSLNCSWCHNPESISPRPQIQWVENRCIGCGTCREACPENLLRLTPEGMLIERAGCSACGRCAEECPAGALEILGRERTIEELSSAVHKDRVYYSGNGGVTLGGGEPALQPRFAAEFLELLKREGIHTAVDTCGFCAAGSLDALLCHTDLLLYDLKEVDPQKHMAFTGHSNERIFANLIGICRRRVQEGWPREIWIRTPVIPGATAASENIEGIGSFIEQHLEGAVSRWDLIAFNNLCRDKYRRLGLDWAFKDMKLLTRESMENLAETARKTVSDPLIVHWSGAVRLG